MNAFEGFPAHLCRSSSSPFFRNVIPSLHVLLRQRHDQVRKGIVKTHCSAAILVILTDGRKLGRRRLRLQTFGASSCTNEGSIWRRSGSYFFPKEFRYVFSLEKLCANDYRKHFMYMDDFKREWRENRLWWPSVRPISFWNFRNFSIWSLLSCINVIVIVRVCK